MSFVTEWLNSVAKALIGVVLIGGVVLFFIVPDWGRFARSSARALCGFPPQHEFTPPRQIYACLTPRECQGRINQRIAEERAIVRNACVPRAPKNPPRWREEYRKVY